MAPDEFGETVNATTMGGSLATAQLLQAGISGVLGDVELQVSRSWVMGCGTLLAGCYRWAAPEVEPDRSRGLSEKVGSSPTTTRRAVWLGPV